MRAEKKLSVAKLKRNLHVASMCMNERQVRSHLCASFLGENEANTASKQDIHTFTLVSVSREATVEIHHSYLTLFSENCFQEHILRIHLQRNEKNCSQLSDRKLNFIFSSVCSTGATSSVR
jgi:hypothetical protein